MNPPLQLAQPQVASQPRDTAITMMQMQRWLEAASTSPNEGVKKAKLKDLLGSR
jgi:hypothetical protein